MVKKHSKRSTNLNRGNAPTEADMATSFISLPDYKSAAEWAEMADWHKRQAKEIRLDGGTAGLQYHDRHARDAARLAKTMAARG